MQKKTIMHPWQKVPIKLSYLFVYLILLVACGGEASESDLPATEANNNETPIIETLLTSTSIPEQTPTVPLEETDASLNNVVNNNSEELENVSNNDEFIDITTLTVDIPQFESYRIHVKFNTVSEVDGTRTEDSSSAEIIQTTDSNTFSVSTTNFRDGYPTYEIISLDDAAYIVTDDSITSGCEILPITELPQEEELLPTEFKALADISTLSSEFNIDLPHLKYVGSTRINNIDVHEYFLLDTSETEKQTTFQVYLAQEGNYLVSFTQLESNLLTGDTSTVEYMLSDVNESFEILPPTNCNIGDLIIYPNSDIKIENNDLVMYETSASVEELASFYQQRMQLMGWTYNELESDQATDSSTENPLMQPTILIFTNETHIQSVIIAEFGEGVRLVNLGKTLLQPLDEAMIHNTLEDHYELGDILLEETFNYEGAWETYSDAGLELMTGNGVYNIKTEYQSFIWGIKPRTVYADIIMEVEVNPITDMESQGAALLCRADEGNTGLGYYFIVRNNGKYDIAISTQANSDFTSLTSGRSDAIIENETNTVRIVCAGNYLALYINDQFVDAAIDSTFPEGLVALAANSATDGTEAYYTFDNVVIQQLMPLAE